jgi:phage-related minor tail protein
MSTAFAIPEVETQLKRFSPTDSAIAVMSEQYLPLTIAGVDDSRGFKLVHAARMDVRAKRVQVEKVRVELKADALAYGRSVDAEAKRITALLEPIEAHLNEEEKAYEDAKEKIREEARQKAEAEARVKAEAEAARLKAIADAEAARVKAEQDAEAARLREERERLEAERRAADAERARVEAEQAAERARQKDEQDKIDADRLAVEAEKKRLADIEEVRLRAIENERIRKEFEEKARIEMEDRVARGVEERKAAEKAKAEAEEAARLRAEALRPDKDKLLAVGAAVEAIIVPPVSKESERAAMLVNSALAECANAILGIVQDMV